MALPRSYVSKPWHSLFAVNIWQQGTSSCSSQSLLAECHPNQTRACGPRVPQRPPEDKARGTVVYPHFAGPVRDNCQYRVIATLPVSRFQANVDIALVIPTLYDSRAKVLESPAELALSPLASLTGVSQPILTAYPASASRTLVGAPQM